MPPQFREKDKRCYVLIGYAPKGTTFRKANLALNEFISDKSLGLVLFHDHFMGTPGGIALFSVDDAQQLAALQQRGPLKGWRIKIHPLIFAENPVEFLYQSDFTMTVYGHKRLKDFFAEYAQSEYARDIDERAAGI